MQIVLFYMCTNVEEMALARKERQEEISNLIKEKLTLSQKAIEAENAQARLKVSWFRLFAVRNIQCFHWLSCLEFCYEG